MALIEEMEQQGIFLFRHRGTLPIFILVAGLIFFVFSEYLRISLGEPPLWFDRYDQILALFFCLLGFSIRAYTVGHSAKNTSGRNTAKQVADEVNTTGIYSAVRHPLYVGNFFMWLGVAVLTMNVWFILTFILLYWVYYERIMFAEEQYLRQKFGEVYLEWARRTPAFIPRFRNWEKPALKFNLKKVLKKEKTGLLAVFSVLFLFDFLQDSIRKGLPDLKIDFWVIAFIFSLIFYFFLKSSQNRLSFLREEA
ncbi:MAG: isoprenylcysteine carboxylmethyltransferase family protein [Bacteroides sp.]|jgi:protein-S-isoprenylcysteine O-methyltransferase Ste14|nr:isoprenylcysteine carboxylmethyltransferase family protein [Bacteroides sp.]